MLRGILRTSPQKRKALRENDKAASPHDTSAYFTAVCETIAHDMPKDEAMRYIEELAKFFNSGWKGLLRLE